MMALKKQGPLGRGLGALIASGASTQLASAPEKGEFSTSTSSSPLKPEAPVAATGERGLEGYKELIIGKIHSNPYQPRREFNLTALQSLKESIRSEGLLQPISVVPHAEGYQLIAGERRLRACRELGWECIPARILEISQAQGAALALIENLQREDLNPIEEALGYATLIRDFGLTQEMIANRLGGRKRSTIANSLRLLQLSEEVQGYLSRRLLTVGHAKVLLQLERSMDQIVLARRIVEQDLSVRETEKRVAQLNRQTLVDGKSSDPLLRAPSETERAARTALESRLAVALGRPVRVQPARNGGRIVLEYTDEANLAALLEQLGVKLTSN